MSALLIPAALVLFRSTTTASASPIPGPSSVPTQVGPPIVSPNINANNTIPTPSVLPPTDGGGQGFSIPAILWIVFCALVGLPLVTAGVRGWKLTSGVGIGLSLAILCQYPCSRSVSGHLTLTVPCVATPHLQFMRASSTQWLRTASLTTPIPPTSSWMALSSSHSSSESAVAGSD